MIKYLNIRRLLLREKRYFFLVLLSGITSFSALIILKLVGISFGTAALFDYTVFRRVYTFLGPLCLLGSGISITRRIGSAGIGPSFNFVAYGYFLSLGLPLILGIVYFMDKSFLDSLLWADQAANLGVYTHILIFWLFAYSLVSVHISFLRGVKRYIEAMVTRLLLLNVLPIAVIIFFDSFNSYLFYSTILMLVFAVSVFIMNNYRRTINLQFHKFKSFFKESIGRMGGDIMFYLIMFLPTYAILALSDDIALAATISFCQLLLGSARIVLQPISFVTLTKVAEDTMGNAWRRYCKTRNSVFVAFLPVTLLLIFAKDFVIQLFYTTDISAFSLEMNVFFMAAPVYAVVISCRSFVDGVTARPVMTWIYTWSLFFGAVSFYLLHVMLELEIFLTISIAFNLVFLMSCIAMEYVLRKRR